MSKSLHLICSAVIGMRIDHKQNIQYVWILLSVTVFLLCSGSCLDQASGCTVAGENMLSVMLILSFPGGLLFFLLSDLFFDIPSVYTPISYFFLWSGAFIIGYIQWFWIIPHLLGGREITTLGLTQGKAVDGRSPDKYSLRAQRPEQPAYICASPALHFDEKGRTPLERAIGEEYR